MLLVRSREGGFHCDRREIKNGSSFYFFFNAMSVVVVNKNPFFN